MDPFLISYFPNSFIKLFARPYIGGESEEKVINYAEKIYREHSYLSTLDALGEDVKSQNDINRFVNLYLEMAKKVSRLNSFPDIYQQPSISMKPSCFVISEKNPDGSLKKDKMDWQGAYDNIYKICDYAREQKVRVTVEMEDRYWTDFTLDTYFKLINDGFDNVGTVLQTRLYRSKEDVNLFNDKSRVRVVIGIYNEPSEAAFTDKKKMKDLMIEFSDILFRKGAFVEFATHDESAIHELFEKVIIPNKIPRNRYEIQMLLGVPRDNIQNELVSGEYLLKNFASQVKDWEDTKVNFRLYLPFAQNWENAIAYCRRRLIENPNIIAYGLKNIVAKG